MSFGAVLEHWGAVVGHPGVEADMDYSASSADDEHNLPSDHNESSAKEESEGRSWGM